MGRCAQATQVRTARETCSGVKGDAQSVRTQHERGCPWRDQRPRPWCSWLDGREGRGYQVRWLTGVLTWNRASTRYHALGASETRKQAVHADSEPLVRCCNATKLAGRHQGGRQGQQRPSGRCRKTPQGQAAPVQVDAVVHDRARRCNANGETVDRTTSGVDMSGIASTSAAQMSITRS